MLVETHLPLGKVDPGIRETERPLAVDRVPEDARLVEGLGFDGLVLTETKEDPFVVMALATTVATSPALGLLGIEAEPENPLPVGERVPRSGG